MTGFVLRPARSPAEIEMAAALFREYADGLGVDLGFQDFAAELAGLPGKYAPPAGEMLLALTDGRDVLGCVALRPLEEGGICEMKRLYVRPAGRRLGIGRALVAAIIAAAEAHSYHEMRLDSLPAMVAARELYRRSGFTEIPAYCFNPIPGTVYMAKRLGGGAR